MFTKEVRDWLNLAGTLIILPGGYWIVHGISMDIKADIAKEYVTKAAYSDDRQRMDADRSQILQSIGEIKGTLQAVQIAEIHDADTLALIKEQLSSKRAP